MGDEAKVKTGAGEPQDLTAECARLANSLRLEQAKNKVLLDEVIGLEDEVVNRCMADFDGVVSNDTREFWREQLLTNREVATAALTELKRAVDQRGVAEAVESRRPLHNRAVARPLPRQGLAGQAEAPAAGDDRAAKIRNRAHEIARSDRVPFSVAFRRAEREVTA